MLLTFISCSEDIQKRKFEIKGQELSVEYLGNKFKLNLKDSLESIQCNHSVDFPFFCYNYFSSPVWDSLNYFYEQKWAEDLNPNSQYNDDFNLSGDTAYLQLNSDSKLRELLLAHGWIQGIFNTTIIKFRTKKFEIPSSFPERSCGNFGYSLSYRYSPFFIVKKNKIKECVSRTIKFKTETKCFPEKFNKQFRWFMLGKYEYSNLHNILNPANKQNLKSLDPLQMDSILNIKPHLITQLDSIDSLVWQTLDKVKNIDFKNITGSAPINIYVDSNIQASDFLEQTQELFIKYPSLTTKSSMKMNSILRPIPDKKQGK